MADTCDSVWSYVECYQWNVCGKLKTVRAAIHNNFVINKITYYLHYFSQGGTSGRKYSEGRSYSNTYCQYPIGSSDKYCTKNTSMKYVSKYNFYKMTQTLTYAHVNYLWRGGYLPSREAGRNSRRLFFIVSPYFRYLCVRMCTCLPITIFLRLSFRLS